MTDLMQMLYDYILESRVPACIDQAKFNLELRRAEHLCRKLLRVLPEPEQQTFQNYQNTLAAISAMEAEAIFQVSLRLSRELG